MAVSPAELARELTVLVRLTASEEARARLRARLQARDAAAAKELNGLADGARERLDLLETGLTELGAPRDLISPLVGQLQALARGSVEQTTGLSGQLLADLGLQHELRERTRYARELAHTLDLGTLVAILERVDTGYEGTIGWLESRLAEMACGEPSLLRPTPLQQAVSLARRVALAPLAEAANTATRLADLAAGLREGGHELAQRALQARQAARSLPPRVIDLADRESETATQG